MENPETALRQICTAWKAKIDAALRHRKPWMDVAEDCKKFFVGCAGFMWEEAYRKKMGLGDYAPTFQLTINKAFELVALFGPSLYWRNPIRTVRPKKKYYAPDEALSLMGVQDEQSYQQVMMSRQNQDQRARVISDLVGGWLNYTPGEHPGGGLKTQAQLAIVDALVSGRGCLTIEPYQYPGSERLLTSAFYLSPSDLVIDPDARNLHEAKWIAVRCVHPNFEVERKYGLQPGSLKGAAAKATYTGVAEMGSVHNSEGKRIIGSSFDSTVYWKVYSKGGVGMRLASEKQDLVLQQLDELVGDYAYIVVPDQAFNYPLNCPPDVIVNAPPDQVKQRFSWPIPYWRDGRWPVAVLDFYPNPDSVWPISPLSPGLGELKFLNVVMSHLCNRIVSSCRDFVTAPKAIKDEVETAIKSGLDLSVIGFTQEMMNGGQIPVSFLQHPNVNSDVWMIVDRVSQQFDKRVGLSELMYGYNPGAASRTAEDAAMKRTALSVRPDQMASQVEDWMTEVAKMEHVCAQMFIGPQDIEPVMGGEAAMLWESLVATQDIESVLRETDIGIEAGTARKPNRDRDAANITQAIQVFMPLMQQYSMSTGDVNPLNELLRQWAEANDFDASNLFISPPPPPPPPEPTPEAGDGGPPQEMAAERGPLG